MQRIDDSIKFIEFCMKEVFWEGALDGEEVKRSLEEVLRQLKLRRADITKLEIIALEELLGKKKKLLKEVDIEEGN